MAFLVVFLTPLFAPLAAGSGSKGHILSTAKIFGGVTSSSAAHFFSDAHLRFPHFPRAVNHQVLEKIRQFSPMTNCPSFLGFFLAGKDKWVFFSWVGSLDKKSKNI